MISRMASPRPGPSLDFAVLADGKWSATTQTPDGPMTAIGDSIAEAKVALDQLLVIARAVEITRRHTSPPRKSPGASAK